ncbi:MAG: hypothetical protein UX26_C0002G0034 [Parcubacteria group bacterium GW2011_GWC1_45_9]|nr:MAG: hypothetical protein UX26_C0002G0034 [Parcubacteria group bacterium GW2011_GWC1_45_9]
MTPIVIYLTKKTKNLKDNQKAIALAEKHKNVFCAIGIYPHEEPGVSLNELEKGLREQLKSSKKIVGIGETGIDLVRSPSLDLRYAGGFGKARASAYQGRGLKEQLELFEMQIKLAVEFSLPLVIHNRNGDKEVLVLAEKYSKKGLFGICHCFVQNWNYGKKMLDYGFYLAFGGIITYDSGEYILETVKKAPLEKILIETDSPWLAPEPLRSSINEPKNIRLVAEKIAEVRGIGYDEVVKITYENGKRLFKLN